MEKGNEKWRIFSSSSSNCVDRAYLGLDLSLVILESELRKAYTSKALQAQICRKEADKLHADRRDRDMAEITRLIEATELEEERQRMLASKCKWMKEYREFLEERTMSRENRERAILEVERNERRVLEQLDSIGEKEEESRVIARRTELAERERAESSIVRQIREIRKQEEQEREAEESLRNIEYTIQLEDRRREARETRLKSIENKEKFIERVATMIMDNERDDEALYEKEALLTEIVLEETKCELLATQAAEKSRRRRLAQDSAADLIEQILLNERCRLKFVEEDRKFAEKVERKIKEDEKFTRLTNVARRRARARYREDLDRLVRERANIRESEMAKIEESLRNEEILKRRRIDRVKEERKRLLAEHAPNIADFFNKSILTSEETAIFK